jgi:hypothetical protein
MKTIMNNKIFMAGAVVCGLALAGCSEDFLDTSSKTESNTETFYKSETDAYRALIGCYDGWRQTSSNPGISFYLASEVMGSECFGALGNSDGRNYQVIDRFNQSESPSDLNIYKSDWARYYEGVYRCNELISREEQIGWKADGSQRGSYIGQAKALRALLYFDMVRLWENIPLLTVPTKEYVAQATPDDVYALIISDLKYAAEHIPEQDGKYDGHITKYAAKALLARVYLFYTGVYGHEPAGLTKAEALAACEDIITSGRYDLVAEYKNLWRPSSGVYTEKTASPATLEDFTKLTGTYAGDDNAEVILSMKFTSTQDYDGNNDGNRWLVMMGVRDVNLPPLGLGWGCCTVDPAFYHSFDSKDTRRDASIVDVAAAGADLTIQQKGQREYTGYTVKKYSPMVYSDGTTASDALEHNCGFQESQFQDYVIVRYADVLLMAAELGSNNGLSYFNKVRARAFGDNSHNVNAVTNELLLQERRWEFAFESINYWDLLRQGLDYAATHLVKNVDVLSGAVADKVVVTADNFKAKRGFCQIPNDEIALSNGTLVQNNGWK